MAVSSVLRSVLLVAADPELRQTIVQVLARAGYAARPVRPDDLSRELDERRHDAVLAVAGGRDADPRQVTLDLQPRIGGLPILLLGEPGDRRRLVGALRHGADDYVLLPPDAEELKVRLSRLFERRELDSRIALFRDELHRRSGFSERETRSSAMRSVVERVERVAPMRSTVLINGESGVGKELVARAIHFNSKRHEGPFMALNCAAMPSSLIESELFGHEKGAFTGADSRVRGKFELANSGTLFLDEIAEMEPAMQAKLLRVLEEREFMRIGGERSIRVDVRVLAATNADLARRVNTAQFRRDLYYRLKVVTIDVPPLRQRRADLPALVDTFLQQLARENAVEPKEITAEAKRALQRYEWPGNVRELKNLIESLLVSVRRDLITVDDLPGSVVQEGRPAAGVDPVAGTTLEEMERDLIRRTLEHTGGNRTHSAQLLGIGVRTLQRKIQGYGIAIPPTRRRSRPR